MKWLKKGEEPGPDTYFQGYHQYYCDCTAKEGELHNHLRIYCVPEFTEPKCPKCNSVPTYGTLNPAYHEGVIF